MKILVIADRALNQPVALKKGARIAQAFGADILLVGFAFDPVVEKMKPQDSKSRIKEIVDENKKRLEGLAQKIFLSPIRYDVDSIWTNNIKDWVVEKTKKIHFDLIIKSGRHSESLMHTPLDWQLIRHVAVPLLITTTSKWLEKPKVLATIDVETNNSIQQEVNCKVLQQAANLTQAMNGELHVAVCKYVSKVLSDLDFVQLREVEEKNKAKFLEKAEKLLLDLGISEATGHFRAGNVANSIHNIAKGLKVDLIVMGSVGRKKLKGLIIGGTAEELMQRIKGDILVIRPD